MNCEVFTGSLKLKEKGLNFKSTFITMFDTAGECLLKMTTNLTTGVNPTCSESILGSCFARDWVSSIILFIRREQ